VDKECTEVRFFQGGELPLRNSTLKVKHVTASVVAKIGERKRGGKIEDKDM